MWCFAPTSTCTSKQRSRTDHGRADDDARLMNLWITIAKPALLEVMQAVDLIIINDGEARMLSGDENLVRAMHALAQETNTHTLIVKRGNTVSLRFMKESFSPFLPFQQQMLLTPQVGDTFAGALAAHLASGSGPSFIG